MTFFMIILLLMVQQADASISSTKDQTKSISNGVKEMVIKYLDALDLVEMKTVDKKWNIIVTETMPGLVYDQYTALLAHPLTITEPTHVRTLCLYTRYFRSLVHPVPEPAFGQTPLLLFIQSPSPTEFTAAMLNETINPVLEPFFVKSEMKTETCVLNGGGRIITSKQWMPLVFNPLNRQVFLYPDDYFQLQVPIMLTIVDKNNSPTYIEHISNWKSKSVIIQENERDVQLHFGTQYTRDDKDRPHFISMAFSNDGFLEDVLFRGKNGNKWFRLKEDRAYGFDILYNEFECAGYQKQILVLGIRMYAFYHPSNV